MQYEAYKLRSVLAGFLALPEGGTLEVTIPPAQWLRFGARLPRAMASFVSSVANNLRGSQARITEVRFGREDINVKHFE